MRVISRKPFEEAKRNYPQDSAAISRAYYALRKGNFSSPDELKRVFPSLDNFKYRDKWWVLDIGGNNLRLIAFIEFRTGIVYVKHLVTHTRYDALTKFYRESKE